MRLSLSLSLCALALFAACDSATPPALDELSEAPTATSLALDDTMGIRSAVANAFLEGDELWERIQACEGKVDVGLKLPHAQTGFKEGNAVLSPAQLEQIARHVEKTPGIELVQFDTDLAMARVIVTDKAILDYLLDSPLLDFVEPGCFVSDASDESKDENAFVKSMSASDGVFQWSSCKNSDAPKHAAVQAPSSFGSDYVSENYYNALNVRWAWERSQGRGIKVGVVGTGVSQSAPQLNSQFSSGLSTGRTITATYHWDDGTDRPWNDGCGHETKLIANIAAPRDGRETVGIAYGADIYSTRVDNDVIVNVDSWHVAEGIKGAARAGSKIINLSLGSRHRWSGVMRAVEFAHGFAFNNKLSNRPLIFGAAGTTSAATNKGVSWPAQAPEVIAVTGIDPDDTPCSPCHFGPEVEFAAQTDEPTIYAFGPRSLRNSGGSSHATSTMSGLAALVWSRYPGWTREQVLDRLRESTFRYQNGGSGAKHSQTGWGEVDASCAVGGLCRSEIRGPIVIEEAGNYTYSVQRYIHTEAPVTYRWSTGHTTPTVTLRLLPDFYEEKHITLTVTLTDTQTGQTYTDGQIVVVRKAGDSCDNAITCGG